MSEISKQPNNEVKAKAPEAWCPVEMSPALFKLFYDHSTSATTFGIPTENTYHERRDKLVPANGHIDLDEKKYFWDLLTNPGRNQEQVAARQTVISDLIADPDRLRSLCIEKSAAKRLREVLKSFTDIDEDESRLARRANRSPQNNLQSALERFDVEAQDLDRLLESASERVLEYGERRELLVLQKLRDLPELQQTIVDFSYNLKTHPNKQVAQFAEAISQRISKLPELTIEKLISIFRSDDLKQLKEFTDELSEIINAIAPVGAVLGAAELARAHQFARAIYDPNEPEQYTNGWNFNWLKKGQTLNSSVPGSLTVLCGGNMSGKSFYLKQTLYMQLWAQSIGWVPAESGNFKIYDSFVYLDRAGTDTRAKLSAFGVDVTKWRDGIEQLGEKAILFADEAYSTTGGEDRFKLVMGSLRYLQERGVRTYLVSHDENVNRAVLLRGEGGLYHFSCGLDSKGDFKFGYQLIPGIDESHSLEVANAMGFPKEIIGAAEDYLAGFRAPVRRVSHRCQEISSYTPEMREELKTKNRSLRKIFGFGDEPELKSNGLTRYYSWKSGCSDAQDNRVRPPAWRRREPAPAVIVSKDQDIKIQSFDLRLLTTRQQPVDREFIQDLLLQGGLTDPQRVLERQQTFAELLKNKRHQLIEGLSEDLSEFLWDICAAGEIEGLSDLAKNLLVDTLDSNLHYKDIDGLKAEDRFFIACLQSAYALSEREMSAAALEELKNKLNRLSDLKAIANKLNYYGEAFFRPAENADSERSAKLKEIAQKYKSLVQQAYAVLGLALPEGQAVGSYELEIVILNFKKSTIDDFAQNYSAKSIWEYSPEILDRAFKILEPVLSELRLYRDLPGMLLARKFVTLCSTREPLSELLTALRNCDSVELHQIAHHIEALTRYFLGNIRNGRQVFHILKATNVSTAKQWERALPRLSFANKRFATHALYNLSSLAALANAMDARGFCKVEFDSSGEIQIDQRFNMAQPLAGQILNSSKYDASCRVSMLSGLNMSGKTFDLKGDFLALLCAHATGYAPAAKMRCPVMKRFAYLDRITTGLDSSLSSFGNELISWNKFLPRDGDYITFAAVDEAFSTVSERYQEALLYGVSKYLLERGHLLATSTHVHNYVEAFIADNPSFAKVFNFQAGVDQEGRVQFAYRKQEGHAKSLGIAVAESLGLQPEIIRFAKLIQLES